MRSCNVTEQDLLDLPAAGQVAISASHLHQLVKSGQHSLSDSPHRSNQRLLIVTLNWQAKMKTEEAGPPASCT
jgi:hypothetical protein